MKQLSLPPTMTERLFRTCFLVFFLLPALSAFSATEYGFYFAKIKVNSDNCSSGYNALTTLNVSNCTNLLELNCQKNAFKNLQVTGLSRLYALNCNFNESLVTLKCDNNALEGDYLQVYGCSALKELSCKNNQLTSIDLSTCGNLQTLSFDNNKFRSINLTQNADLRTLSCADNLLNNLDFSNNPMLTSLKCSSNNINSLDLSNKGHLEQLECQYNGLNSLSLEGCYNLVSVDCSNNNLTTLVMPQSSWLKTLYCYANKISGPNMNALVTSLPNRRYNSVSGVFRVFTSSSLEGNVCTTTNVSNAWEKNWQAYWNNGSSWQVYDGASLPTSVTAVASEDDSAPLYNLSGQRVGEGYKGLVIRNGRKVRK